MYYGLCNHIYLTQFRDEVIILNTIKDRYTICSPQFSLLLSNLLNAKLLNLKQDDINKYDYFNNIKKLLDDNIIEKIDAPYPFYIDYKPESEGVSNVDWVLPLESKKINLSMSVLQAFITLVKVNLYIKFKGFYATIQLIKKSCNTQLNYFIPKESELENLAHIVNQACLIFPTRTKCLEWVITYVLLALKQKWRCNLEIGVQNYPFFAHAWVECNDKVVMDSQDLRKGLAIILNEPFRKLKQ